MAGQTPRPPERGGSPAPFYQVQERSLRRTFPRCDVRCIFIGAVAGDPPVQAQRSRRSNARLDVALPRSGCMQRLRRKDNESVPLTTGGQMEADGPLWTVATQMLNSVQLA